MSDERRRRRGWIGSRKRTDTFERVPRLLLPLLFASVLPAASCRSRRSAPAPAPSDTPPAAAPDGPRLFILALDGVDLESVQRWADEGRLPGFARLRERGEFSWMRTTEPPTAEAAWTALVTGLPPAESGVVGPLRIDHRSHATLPGTVEIDAARAPPRVSTRRSGQAFWTAAARGGVRARVLWAPYELPPERLESGEVLAGLGIPHLGAPGGRGTLLGAAFPEGVAAVGPVGRIRLLPSAAGWSAALPGPLAPGDGRARFTVPVDVLPGGDPSRRVVAVSAGRAELAVGGWSPRLPVRFGSGDLRIDGLARFLLLDPTDLPLVLAAPLELDPASPWFPICEPPGWAAELAARYGRVPTVGAPGDLEALDAGALPEEAYLADLAEDFAARSGIVLAELERGGFELFVAFVPLVERVTLGLRRLADPDHPRWDAERAAAPAAGFGGVRLQDAELAAYAFVDDLVGRVADRLRPGDVLLVLSDHAPRAWRRSVHLGTWLRREGLLVLHERAAHEGTPVPVAATGLRDVDWTRTQAYALGGPYILLNLQGREPEGTVEPGERYDRIVERIEKKLLGWVDADAGDAPVVRRVLVRGRELRGRREDALPDMVVVFADGYRESRETIAGEVPDGVLEPNRTIVGADYGSGDAAERRGFVYSTRPLVLGDPGIEDVGASVLGFFGATDTVHGLGRDWWR